MPYLEKRIISGDMLEVERYFATRAGNKMPRSGKENESSKGQEDLNNRNAQKRLVRLLNTNFDGKRGDLFVTLTYETEVDEETAKREARNYIRRIRNYRRKSGLPELKYILIHEKQGKWHHHIIMSSMDRDEAERIWGHGRSMASRLDATYCFKDLAGYLMKHEKPSKGKPDGENKKEPRRKHTRRWISSRNLDQPIITVKEIKRISTRTQPIAPHGYRLLPDWKCGCDVQGNLYQVFTCIKLEESPKTKRRCRPAKERRKKDVLQNLSKLRGEP